MQNANFDLGKPGSQRQTWNRRAVETYENLKLLSAGLQSQESGIEKGSMSLILLIINVRILQLSKLGIPLNVQDHKLAIRMLHYSMILPRISIK